MLWSRKLGPWECLIRECVFPDTANRVAGLFLVLDEIQRNVSEGQLSDKETADLSSLIKGTSDVLEEVTVVLDKYKSLGQESPTVGSKVEKVWKKIRWDPDAIKDFRSRIISNTAILDTFCCILTSKASQKAAESLATLDERVAVLQLDNDQQERHALSDWLTTLNFPAQQSVFFSRRQEGTCQWLFQSEEFKTWMDGPGQTLLCRGMPGAGKTILASTVIDHLLTTLYGDKIFVAYIYCDYRKQHEQTPVNLIASILKQSLRHHISIPENVRKSYRHHTNSGTRLNAEEIHALLQSTLSGFSQIYIVADAVDELSNNDQVRQTLLSSLNALQKVHTVNLMVTSRFIPRIAQELRDPLCLEIRASDEDVRRYVQGHINDLAKCVPKNLKLQELVEDSIVTAVDGMFLLAQLHMDSLTDKTSPKAIKKALENLPKGSDALDISYKQAMQRIEDQKPGFSDLAKRTLSWITYAYELLTVAGLRHALAIEIGESIFDEENLDDIEDVLSVCCGLVIIDPETEALRLVHYTTQDYFKKFGSCHFPNAREDIAVSCLTYLLFNEFGEGWVWNMSKEGHTSWEAVEARLQKYPFLLYAARFWARHAKDCPTNFEDRMGKLLVEFLTDDFKVSSVGQILLKSGPYYVCIGFRGPSRTPMSGMHLATYVNFAGLMSYLLEAGLFTADVKDQADRTPLIWAADKGHVPAVKVLLHRQDVDVNAIDNYVPAMTVLLHHQDVDVNAIDNFESTDRPRAALSYAAMHGHGRIVELLLEREDIDVNIRDERHNMTPLMFAIATGREAVLKILLKHKDIVTDKQYPRGGTALHWASDLGHRGGVQTLLERGDFDADRESKMGETPLSTAASMRNLGVVKFYFTM
ncbi:MAG: hypothetical protein ASARMPREDX12_003269 [Alectoria sarmentosa]|nr:MAG: hypothetical protein ASARMPREDX12_003269 [Alectoria sarmentosa]